MKVFTNREHIFNLKLNLKMASLKHVIRQLLPMMKRYAMIRNKRQTVVTTKEYREHISSARKPADQEPIREQNQGHVTTREPIETLH